MADFVTKKELLQAFASMICSISGWRKIFASGEESAGRKISPADSLLVQIAAEVFGSYVLRERGSKIILGMDRRPTGKAIAEILKETFLCMGLDVYYRKPCPSPEIMAFTAQHSADAFCYITASHNPLGHNGFKFGNAAGMILPPEPAAELINALTNRVEHYKADNSKIVSIGVEIGKKKRREKSGSLFQGEKLNRESQKAYFLRLKESVFRIPGRALSTEEIDAIRKKPKLLSVLIDANGCARGRSIDREWLSFLGIGSAILSPNTLHHPILPEGPAMEPCMRALERYGSKDPSFRLGYVSDGDGDRGNIIYRSRKKSHQLSAQETFALLCLARLSWVAHYVPHAKQAIVINDATSQAVVELAGKYNAQVFRTETGEANVTAGIAAAANEGYFVSIAGEGSNGGVIQPPAMVRDPLSAISSLALFLNMETFQSSLDTQDPYDLKAVLDRLPQYICTTTGDPRALVPLKSGNRLAILQEFLKKFRTWLTEEKKGIARYNITNWQHLRYTGIKTDYIRKNEECNNKYLQGGHCFLLLDAAQHIRARAWVRPSGTESIFRIMADVRGKTDLSHELAALLMEKQQMLLQEAGRQYG